MLGSIIWSTVFRGLVPCVLLGWVQIPHTLFKAGRQWLPIALAQGTMPAAGHMSVQLIPLLFVGQVGVHAVDNPL